MAKVKLAHEDGDIAIMLRNLMTTNKTNLVKVCEKHGLNYGNTNRKINTSKTIDLDDLEELIKMIDPKAKVEVGFNLTVFQNGKTVFTQKIEK